MKRKQYTIRAVPLEVDRSLRRRARMSGKSLNQIVVEALTKAALGADAPKRFDELDALAGAWVDDPEFDGALATFEQVDADLWRCPRRTLISNKCPRSH